MDYRDRLLKAIPGGAHTYSRGFDQFPRNVPQILRNGKGVYVFDSEGKKYLALIDGALDNISNSKETP
jgi:glutamate-1-semialdehyde 2,1-aminomutase